MSASGQSSADLSITKAGNRRLRTDLVELAWRLLLYQPEYYLVNKWKHILLNPKAHRRARKRAIIAHTDVIAPCFVADTPVTVRDSKRPDSDAPAPGPIH